MQDKEIASAMDQEISRKIKEAWAQGKDASGAAAFRENGEIALGEGKQQEAKKHFKAAEQELARIRGRQTGSGMSAGYCAFWTRGTHGLP